MRKKFIGAFLVFLLAAPAILARAEPPAGADPASRKVSIVFLVDGELVAAADTQSVRAKIEAEQVKAKIRKIVADGSKVYEKEFGISFVVEGMESWDFPAGQTEVNADKTLRAAALIADSEAADITIAITKKPFFRCYPAEKGEEVIEVSGCDKGEKKKVIAGYAYRSGNAALIALDKGDGVFIHEMGHIFGAEHTSEDSIMNDKKIGKSFDARNRNIILRNRTRSFDKMRLPR